MYGFILFFQRAKSHWNLCLHPHWTLSLHGPHPEGTFCKSLMEKWITVVFWQNYYHALQIREKMKYFVHPIINS